MTRHNTGCLSKHCLHRLSTSRSHSEIPIVRDTYAQMQNSVGAVVGGAEFLSARLADACANETTTPPVNKAAPVPVDRCRSESQTIGNAHYWLALRVTIPANLPSTSPAGSFDPTKLMRSFSPTSARRTEFPSTVAKFTLDVTL